jgi:hypothetical protein
MLQHTRSASIAWILRAATLILLACILVGVVFVVRTPGAAQTPAPTYTLRAVSMPAPLPATSTIGVPLYPLQRSKDGRRLVDQRGAPFLIVGDSPQALIANLSEAQAASYLATRQAQGFNTLWVNLLCDKYTGCRSDGSTYDGILPFVTPGDLSTPNPAYFQRADDMIRLAALHRMVVFLDPIETGGWLDVLRRNGVSKDRAYGRYLGNRYKNFANIVWMSGNDFQSWTNPADDAVAQAVAQGIEDVDPRHLQTVELNYYVSDSLQDPAWAPIIGLDAAYTYYPTYAEVLQAYDRGTMPVFMVEANYEGEHNAGDLGTPLILRRQEYWTMLSGASGQIFGNHYVWPFSKGWQSNLNTPAVRQLQYATALFLPTQWYNLVPDQRHQVLTGGYGTFNGSGTLISNDYATAARTMDGSLVIAYLPTKRTVTVDMSRLSGRVWAYWYDPTSGASSEMAGSPFANKESHQFASPGENSAGDADWVLVLETRPRSR